MIDYEVTELQGNWSQLIRSVLIVEDHELMRDALHSLLTKISQSEIMALEILQASSLQEAEKIIEKNPNRFDLVLLDLNLPDGNPEKELEYITGKWAGIPIAIISATEDWGVVLKFMQAGVLGYISKRSSLDIIRTAISLIFAGGRYFPEDVFRYMRAITLAKADEEPTFRSHDFSNEAPMNEDQHNAHNMALSPRQNNVLALMLKGYSNKEIARELSLSIGTAKNHVAAVMHALGVTSRSKLISTFKFDMSDSIIRYTAQPTQATNIELKR